MHRALSYLLVVHGSIAVPPTHLHSAPLGVCLYQVAVHAPFVASFLSFVFGVVHCTVLATSRCNNVHQRDIIISSKDRYQVFTSSIMVDFNNEYQNIPVGLFFPWW